MEPEDQEHSHKKGSRLFIILFFAVILLVAFGALTLFQRRAQYQALAKETDPDIKAAAYAELGINVTYHADGRALLESRPRIDGVAGVGVGGGT